MQNLSNRHLSEEALDELLIGGGSAADVRHLAACEACCSRLAEFRTPLAIFNQASAAWSDARSNSISRELTPCASSHAAAAAAWSLACMTILVIGVSLTGHLRRSPDTAAFPENEQRFLQQAAATGPQEIASDNAMLAAIDSKLSEPVRSPVVADVEESIKPTTHHTATGEVRD